MKGVQFGCLDDDQHEIWRIMDEVVFWRAIGGNMYSCPAVYSFIPLKTINSGLGRETACA